MHCLVFFSIFEGLVFYSYDEFILSFCNIVLFEESGLVFSHMMNTYYFFFCNMALFEGLVVLFKSWLSFPIRWNLFCLCNMVLFEGLVSHILLNYYYLPFAIFYLIVQFFLIFLFSYLSKNDIYYYFFWLIIIISLTYTHTPFFY